MDIGEINKLLEAHGFDHVSVIDSPAFLAASVNRNVIGIQPLFNAISFDWLLASLENKAARAPGASIVVVSGMPGGSLMSPDYANYRRRGAMDLENETDVVTSQLVADSQLHRRKLIEESLSKGNVHSYFVCANCLECYVNSWKRQKSDEERKVLKAYIEDHVERLIHYLETYPDNYRFHLTKCCSSLVYEILYLPSGKSNLENAEKPGCHYVFFKGHQAPCKNEGKGPEEKGFTELTGFASNLERIMKFFHMQYEEIKRNHIVVEHEKPDAMIRYLKDLIRSKA